jgi:DNA-binding LacI/PurR family transcriptional regulator
MVTEHLIAQGHRRIGFLGDEAFAETVQMRWRGYTLALQEAGITPLTRWIALFHDMKVPMFADYMKRFLEGEGEPVTAVVCSNDTTALVFLNFLRGAGYRVPEDVAVTGYGNLLPDYMDALELTTMAQPFEEVGQIAGKILLEQLAMRGKDKTSPVSFTQVDLPVELIVRSSSTAR